MNFLGKSTTKVILGGGTFQLLMEEIDEKVESKKSLRAAEKIITKKNFIAFDEVARQYFFQQFNDIVCGNCAQLEKNEFFNTYPEIISHIMNAR